MNIQYIGEHLVPGQVGRIFIWVAFFTAVTAMILYLISARKEEKGEMPVFRPVARGLFMIHTFSLVMVAAILYYLIFNHYFEYTYVWQYSSTTLPLKYIISCFWAGQEGSFLIWAVFQAFLGVVIIFISRHWENRVMSIVALSQFFMTSMMLGIQFFSIKIGGNPFNLLRDTFGATPNSIFEHPDYLSMLGDGNGLNPLLENIWMTIHPPVLFLGYALSLIPFSYAVSSLVRKDYYSWIKPALPWTILSLTVLGAGILLGGAWAYVSLTFGGFWAWDPVENSSLVPWMTLIASLHFMIIARKQRHALFSAFTFTCLTYVLVLYASFLTRSGVLAETSAHSFGDNGMTGQLLVFLLVFFVIAIVLISMNIRKFAIRKQEIMMSREFWMFIGSVIVILAAFQIIFTTSIPVINSLFHTGIAPPLNPAAFYNKWQLPFVLLIAAFIGFTQFLNYLENDPKAFFKKASVSLIMALVLMVPVYFTGIVTEARFVIFLFFLLFAILSSVYNLIFGVSKPANLPAVITHIGFLIFVCGVVLTFSNARTISANTSRFDLGDTKSNQENLMLVRGDTLYMGGFHVVYTNSWKKGNEMVYQVDFLKSRMGQYKKAFSLYPTVNRNPKMGDVYNPDTRHFLWVDYYTYISYVGVEPDYIVIKTIMNPYINVLWFGSIVMLAGFIWAFTRRRKQNL